MAKKDIMISIGIIIPSWRYYADPFHTQPLNELYFATIIDYQSLNNVKVNIIDLRKSKLSEINTFEYNIFFYWIMKTADLNEIISITKQFPKIKHIAGGTQVEILSRECKKYFDVVIKGPGEEAIIDIIYDFKNTSLKREYIYSWKSSNYNEYPFPIRKYLPSQFIVNRNLFKEYKKINSTSVMFSRGCNFKCIYCTYNIPDIIQRRSPKLIKKEIQYLKNIYKIKGLVLRDEICIPLSKKYSLPFFEAIGSMNIIWRGQTRVLTNKDILILARESGCVELAVGIESVSQEVLNIINKKQTINHIKKMIYICKIIGIKVKACFILGLPGEPHNIFDLMKTFIDEIQPDYVNISGFCPMPGSAIFNNKSYFGIEHVEKDWNKYAHLMCRYSDKENHGLPFRYKNVTRWGKSFSRNEIFNNIKNLQHYCRDRGMLY